MANSLAEYSISDLIPEELAELAERLNNENYQGIVTTPGEARQPVYYVEFCPNEDRLKAIVLSIFYEPI